jgi:hypothetical protein
LKFIKLLEDDDTGNIQVDSPFMLECRTNRPTYQIRWFKDNREISQFDQVMKTISDGCTHVLQVSLIYLEILFIYLYFCKGFSCSTGT